MHLVLDHVFNLALNVFFGTTITSKDYVDQNYPYC